MNFNNDNLQLLNSMQFLEYFAAKTARKSLSTGDLAFNTGEPVRYIGFEFPELHGQEGIVINARLVQGLIIVHFSGLGEWHIRPENLVKSN